MDGTGELFAGFLQAMGDTPTLVVAYPPGQVLDYEGATNFARARLPLQQPFVLLGESFSGPVAIALAAARPPGLLGLILCCSFARNPAPVFSASVAHAVSRRSAHANSPVGAGPILTHRADTKFIQGGAPANKKIFIFKDINGLYRY
jgi:pimeloyl-ACP methyl ester carboxylesterase